MTKILFEVRKYKKMDPVNKVYEILDKYPNGNNMEGFVNNLRTGEYDYILKKDEEIISPETVKTLSPFTQNDLSRDYEKAIKLHQALKIDRMEEATDPRLWSYLSLAVYRDYICERWKLSKNSKDAIKRRLFYISSSTMTNSKHALARLWWSVEMTKGIDPKDEYKYTKQILSSGKSQIMFDLLERRYIYRNKEVIKAYLDFFSMYAPKMSTGENLTKTSGKMVKFLYNHIKNYDIRFWTEKEIKLLLDDFNSIINPKNFLGF